MALSLRSRLALPRLLRRPLALRLALIPCLTFLFLVLAVPLARQVSCPVLSLVLVSLFQLRRWLGREQSGVPPCVPCSRPRVRPPSEGGPTLACLYWT